MPWTPLNLSNLVGFWTAASVTQGSGIVTAWPDQGPTGNNLVPPTSPGPGWSGTAFNGAFPGITFNGSKPDVLQTAALNLSTTTLSYFCLFTDTQVGGQAVASARILSIADVGGGGVDYMAPGASASAVGTANPGNYYSYIDGYLGNGGSTAGISLGINIPVLYGLILDGSHAHLYNAAAEAMPSTAFASAIGAGAAQQLNIGTDQGLGEAWSGTMAYTILTSGVMSASDIANLITWTNNNWGTSFAGGIGYVPYNPLPQMAPIMAQ